MIPTHIISADQPKRPGNDLRKFLMSADRVEGRSEKKRAARLWRGKRPDPVLTVVKEKQGSCTPVRHVSPTGMFRPFVGNSRAILRPLLENGWPLPSRRQLRDELGATDPKNMPFQTVLVRSAG